MRRYKIHNLGPVKNAEFSLNKINVFIGPQSAGKSTLEKIISFMMWLEKEAIKHQDTDFIDDNFINEQLVEFHKLSGYFNANTIISYQSDIIGFEYGNGKHSVKKMDGFSKGEYGKNSYIPAERNIVGLSNISAVPFQNNYIRSYLFDWLSINKRYTKDSKLDILDLGVKYLNDEKKGDQFLLDDGNSISLENASSGLQSLTPLYVFVDYLTSKRLGYPSDESYDSLQEKRKGLLKKYLEVIKLIRENKTGDDITEVLRAIGLSPEIAVYISKELFNNPDLYTKLMAGNIKLDKETVERIFKHMFCNIVIEEPELNLFPKTQLSLMYYLVKAIQKNPKDTLVLTTHSPYILYALNNCILSYHVKDKLPKEISQKVNVPPINPQTVSVWSVNDGKIEGTNAVDGTIQDENGLIRKNYFDSIMGELMDDFRTLLDYYGEEE